MIKKNTCKRQLKIHYFVTGVSLSASLVRSCKVLLRYVSKVWFLVLGGIQFEFCLNGCIKGFSLF